MKVYLVHHTPMDDAGIYIARELGKTINDLTDKFQVILIDIKQFRSLGDEKKETVVGALFPTRGGHYNSIKEIAIEKGYRFIGKLSNKVFSTSILIHLENKKCSSLDILYWGAKSNKTSQLEDLIEIKKSINVFVNTNLLEYPSIGDSSCGIPLTLFPSTITLHVIKNYRYVPIRFLLDKNISFFAGEIVKFLEKNL